MSTYCLKTGGVIVVKGMGAAFECDLHVVGNALIAVTCPPMTPGWKDTEFPRITAIVEEGADYFYRERGQDASYGILVVEQDDVWITPLLSKHIDEWYSGHAGRLKMHRISEEELNVQLQAI